MTDRGSQRSIGEFLDVLASGTYPHGSRMLLSDDGRYSAVGVLAAEAGVDSEDLRSAASFERLSPGSRAKIMKTFPWLTEQLVWQINEASKSDPNDSFKLTADLLLLVKDGLL